MGAILLELPCKSPIYKNFSQNSYESISEYAKIIQEILQFTMQTTIKDLSRIKPGFKSVPPQFHFEITGLASAVKWREIQNIDEEEHF